MSSTTEDAGAHEDLLEAVAAVDRMIAAGRIAEARAWLRVVKKLEVERRNWANTPWSSKPRTRDFFGNPLVDKRRRGER